MKQSKQLLELKLKEKYHLIWDNIISKSKLELINLIRHRDDMLDRMRADNEWHGKATIKVYVDGELKHEVNYEMIDYTWYKDNIFEVARNLEYQYIDWANVKTEILFEI
jgi:type I site-specific restriction-modification system R (restriction) subunit